MAMNEAERKVARKAAYLRWYAKKHGRSVPTAAVNKAAKTKTEQKKVEPNRDLTLIEKAVDKLVKKNVKTIEQVKSLVKDAAQILGDAYKTEDEKLIARTLKALGKNLNLKVEDELDSDKPKKSVRLDIGAKLFRVPPKPKAEEAVVVEETDETKASDEKTEEGKFTEVVVDPETAAKLVDDPDLADDVISSSSESDDATEDGIDEDDDDYEDDEDEDEDEDEDDLTDEEREERAERRRRKEEDDFLEGRAETMAEMDAQGAEWGEQ